MPDEKKPDAPDAPAATEPKSDEEQFSTAFDEVAADEAGKAREDGDKPEGEIAPEGGEPKKPDPPAKDKAGEADAAKTKSEDEAGGKKPGEEEPPPEAEPDEAKRRAAENERAERHQRTVDQWWADVAKLHPDVDEIRPLVREWLKTQPEEVRKRANGTPADAALVIGEFKRAQAEQEARGADAGVAPEVADFLGAHGLANVKMKVTDAEGNAADGTLAEVAKLYPDIVQAAAVIAQAVIRKQMEALDKRLQGLPFATRDDLQEFGKSVGNLRLAQAHPDHAAVAKSKEFQDFLEAQEPALKRLWASEDPDDRIAFMSSYKRHQQTAANAARRKERGEELDQRRKLHGSTLRGDGGGRKPGDGTPRSDDEAYEAAWEEAAEKERQG